MNNIHIVQSILEIRHLRTLRAIQDTGSLAAAAQMISLTQSALSHQMKQLEAHYEVPLFTRDTRPMTLTDSGRKLLDLANEVLPKIDEAEGKLSLTTRHASRFHVAIECHSCFDWLLPSLNHVRKHWPDLDIDARMAFDALPLLEDGQLDIVISSDPVESSSITFNELFQYEALLLVSPQHALAKKTYITPGDLQSETFITYPVEPERLDVFKHFLEPAGLHIANQRTSELTDMIVQHVASQRGVAVLPDWVLRNNDLATTLITLPLGKHGVHRTVYAAVRNEDAQNIELKDFIEFTPSVIRNMKR